MDPVTETPVEPQSPPATERTEQHSIHDAVAAAYDKAAAAAESGGESPVEKPVGAPVVRDPQTGKFTKGKAPEKPAVPAPGTAPAQPGAVLAPTAPAAPASPEEGEEQPEPRQFDRPPQSWRGPAKAEWTKLPAPVKAEVQRLERERESVLRESKSARVVADSFAEVVRPYEGFIRAAGHTPLQSVDGLMRTAAQLRTGTDWERAVLAAGIIRAHGINPEWVGYALQNPDALPGGAASGPQPGTAGEFKDPRVDQLLEELGGLREQGEAQADAAADEELDGFIAQHPLAGEPDVQQRMARAIDLAADEGVDLSFEEAYGGVLAVDADLRSLAEQQGLVAGATNPQGSTARAEAAALSVRPSPVVEAPTSKTLRGKSVEDHVRAAYDQATSRSAKRA